MASAVAELGEDEVPENLLCPICFELPDREVHQCGHVLCKACFVKLKQCPHCHRSLGVTPPTRDDMEELFSLAENGDLQSFKSLVVKAPPHENIQNDRGWLLLHVTMLDPDKKVGLEKAKFLVEEMNADVFVLTKRKVSLLHFAAYYSDYKAVEYFLEKGLDINAVGGAIMGTPLHFACFNEEFGEENAKMLLRYKPDCTLKDGWGMNPLESAVGEGRQEIANLIRKAS